MSGARLYLTTSLTLALLLPAWSSLAATARHAPAEQGCTGKFSDKKFNDAKAKMEDPKKIGMGLTTMRTNGPEGCAALVEWLDAGAPNGGEDQIEDVVGWVGRSDAPGAMDAVLKLANSEYEEVREEAVKVLEERLVELSADEVAQLTGSAYPEVRKGAAGIFAGHHSIGQIELVQTAGGFGPTIPMWVEQEFYGSPDPPPAAHVAGLDALVKDSQNMVREQCGVVMGRMLKEHLGTDPSYGPHLLTLIQDADEDTAEAAAYGAGWGCPDNAAEIVAAVVASTHGEVASEFMDSFEELVEEFDPRENALAMADAMMAGGNDSMKKQAEKLRKKIEKNLSKKK